MRLLVRLAYCCQLRSVLRQAMAAHKHQAAFGAEYVAVTLAFADQMVVAAIDLYIIQIAPAIHDDGFLIARLHMRRNTAAGPKTGQPGTGVAVIV